MARITFAEKPTAPNFIDRTGCTYGRLTVLGFAGREKMVSKWWCKCECGSVNKYHGGNLKQGFSTQCNECCKAMNVDRLTKHGMSRSPEYGIYRSMLQRCANPNNPNWKHYGGRGISVCQRWLDSFDNFIADMGERPSPELSIDRIDNDGNYEPSNCRWATPHEQAMNTRRVEGSMIEFEGKTLTMLQWAKELGISRQRLYQRLKVYSVEEALSTPKGQMPEGKVHRPGRKRTRQLIVRPKKEKEPSVLDISKYPRGKVQVVNASKLSVKAKELADEVRRQAVKQSLPYKIRTLDNFVMFRVGA